MLSVYLPVYSKFLLGLEMGKQLSLYKKQLIQGKKIKAAGPSTVK